jgi:hypothetical protein
MFCFTFGGGQINFKSITLIFYLFKCPNLFEKKNVLKSQIDFGTKISCKSRFSSFST